MKKIHRTAVAVAVAATATIGLTVAGGALASDADREPHHTARAADADRLGALSRHERRLIRQHTKKYRDVDVAIADGYLPTDVCVAAPDVGGMGYHYVHPGHASDDVIDPATPEILVYQVGRNGRLRLGAVEYFRADADQDLATDADRPALFGRYEFDGPMEGHEPGMPVHYDLHVWLYRHNPVGELAAFNPNVTCPG